MKAIVEKLDEKEKEGYEVMVRGRWRPMTGLPSGAIPTGIRERPAATLGNRPRPGQRIALVQLERLGDILSILPLAYRLWQEGNTVDWYGKPAFTWILKHCAYINAVFATGDSLSDTLRELTLKNSSPRTSGDASPVYDRFICPQVDQNPVPVADRGVNFIRQQWLRGGRPEGLDEGWPPVFDREVGLLRWDIKQLSPKPIMLVNLDGRSSRLTEEQQHDLKQWLGDTFGARFLIEYWPSPAAGASKNRVPTLPTLLNMLTAVNLTGGLLLSIDSAPIHLAAATSTPTVVLSRGGWDASERRPHWIGWEVKYADLFENQLGRLQIEGKLGAGSSGGKVYHVVDWWLPTKLGDEYDRIVAARRTWCVSGNPLVKVGWEVVPFCGLGRRSAADLPPGADGKVERNVPYIKDIIEFGIQQARLRSGSDQSWVVFTNSDIHLCADAELILANSGVNGCAFSRRRDFPDLSSGDLSKPIATINPRFRHTRDHVGADLFAMQVWWWEAHRDEVPDLIMSFEGWDFCVRHLFWKYNKAAQLPTCCYHQIHESNWSRPENLLTSPGQVHNRRVGAEWARSMGLPVSDSGHQLFDPDPPDNRGPP